MIKIATLYELTGQYAELLELLENPEIDEKTVLDTLESMDFLIEDKAENYAKIIKELEGNINTLDNELDRLKSKKTALQNNITRLKDNLYQSMKTTGKTKFKTELFNFNIAKNGGALPLIVDVDTSELPDDFVIVTEAPDKKALVEHLKKNPDCKWAHFGERGEHLSIK